MIFFLCLGGIKYSPLDPITRSHDRSGLSLYQASREIVNNRELILAPLVLRDLSSVTFVWEEIHGI